MSGEQLFGNSERSSVPFEMDSPHPSPNAISPDRSTVSGQVNSYEVWENDSDVMESLSSDPSPPPDSMRGEGNSQDSWNGDDEDSMSDEIDSWVRSSSTRHHTHKRKTTQRRLLPSDRFESSVAAIRDLRFVSEAARMEQPSFNRDDGHGISPTDEAEMLADEVGDLSSEYEELPSSANRRHYHSDNDITMRMLPSVSADSNVVAYSESDLIGPNARDFAFNTPTVFPKGSAFSASRRTRSISMTPRNSNIEGNNENMPRKKVGSKRKSNAHAVAPTKPPLTLPTKTRLSLHIKKWSLGALWKWNAGDENCGICRMPFEACCTDCKTPGDDCPLALGTCKHSFHMHCIVKWTETQNSPRPQCPLCRQEWVFATE